MLAPAVCHRPTLLSSAARDGMYAPIPSSSYEETPQFPLQSMHKDCDDL